MYNIDNTPVGCYYKRNDVAVVLPQNRSLGTKNRRLTLPGYFCALKEVIMSAKSGFPPKNSLSQKAAAAATYSCPYCNWIARAAVALEYHINRYHEKEVAAEGGRAREGGIKLNRFGTRDYGLPYWECPQCHYRVGPALLPDRMRPCQWWQNMEGTGKKCDGILAKVA